MSNPIVEARVSARQNRVNGYMAKQSLNVSEIGYINQQTIRQVRKTLELKGLSVDSKGLIPLSELISNEVISN